MRRLSVPLVLAVAAAAACLLAPARTGGAEAAVLPSIYVDYDDDCVFSMRADGGITLAATTAPGATIPPGIYQVVLRVPENAPTCPLRFHLQGPGVLLDWDFEGEALTAHATETLQPDSTYVATDLRNPARYRAVFTTATSGSSGSLVTQPPSTAAGKGETSKDVVGSASSGSRRVLSVSLVASAISVKAGGEAVASLPAGRFTVALDDRTSRAGLTVRRPDGRRVTLTGAAFVGRRTTTLALTPGAWRFSSSGARTRTVVVSSTA